MDDHVLEQQMRGSEKEQKWVHAYLGQRRCCSRGQCGWLGMRDREDVLLGLPRMSSILCALVTALLFRQKANPWQWAVLVL